MELFWKTTAGVLLTVILVMAVGKQEKDIALVLTLAVCCMGCCAAFSVLEPVLDLFFRLETVLLLRRELLKRLLKITGIGIIGEIAAMICHDSGLSALGKMLQLLTTAAILYLSVPLFEDLVFLLQDILGGL